MTADAKQRRWYDKDPLLSEAMKTLEKSSDENQIRLAMHLVKIISEHNIDVAASQSVDGRKGDDVDEAAMARNARWYDIDRTLKNSVEMLQYCQIDTQRSIAREMAKLLKDFMAESENIDNV